MGNGQKPLYKKEIKKSSGEEKKGEKGTKI